MAKEKDDTKEIEDHIQFHKEIAEYNRKKADAEAKKFENEG